MIECQKCKGRAQLYLCPLCMTELRQQLLRMPRLVGYLQDTALGLTRMSNEVSRSPGFESRTPTFDDRASELVEEIERLLGQWARPLAITHGYVISPPANAAIPISRYTHSVGDYVVFLAAHVDQLAKDEYIGELCASLRQYIKRAVGGREEGGLLNRRTPAQFCGPCPATITDHRHCVDKTGAPTCRKQAHECATRLMSRRGALEVTCPSCGAQHRVERLITHLLARASDFRATLPEIYQVLRMLGTPVKLRTLEHWATPKVGRLRPAGYLRPDNRRIGATRHFYDDGTKDTPVYRIADARSASAEHRPGRGNHVRTEQMREKTSQSVKKSLKSKGRKQKS